MSNELTRRLAVIVLAAGQGTRMKSARPKVLHEIGGRSMLGHVLDSIAAQNPQRVVVVVGPDMEAVSAAAHPHEAVVQEERLGTGHAVAAARPALEDLLAAPGGLDVLVVFGDTPLLKGETLSAMRTLIAGTDRRLAALAFEPIDPARYGRVVLDDEGLVARMVEAADADEAEGDIGLCNGGMLAAEGGFLFELVEALDTGNAAGEYYLTDIFALAHAAGSPADVVLGHEEEVLGINDRRQLAMAEALFQDRARAKALREGVTMVDPGSVWLSVDTRLAPDVFLEPGIYFGPGVTVEEGARIRAYSHLEGVHVGAGAQVGPFARLRPGSVLDPAVRVGNFVEIKNATLHQGAKANHLSYIGDATVGAGANVGAGTITCNYDGVQKHHTEIGAGAFIGSNSALVAPVRVGEGAFVAAGSTITRDVAADDLAVVRGEQRVVAGGAKRLRARQRTKKQR